MDFENDIKQSVKVIEAGGTVLYPTDTIWGIGCSALDAQAVEKVFAIKNRPKEKSLILLMATTREVLQYVAAPPPDLTALLDSFERPTTVVYEHALGLPENVIHPDGSIAIRVTSDPFCRALIRRLRKPVVSTSANISGEPSPALFRDISAGVKEKVDYVVQYRQEEQTASAPSRLVKMRADGSLEILRA